jgi:hypothetical protein
VLCVPELGRDEDVFTLEARDVLESTLDALGNFLLVLVTVIGGKMDQLTLFGNMKAKSSRNHCLKSTREEVRFYSHFCKIL